MVNRLGSSLGPSAIEGKETLLATLFSVVWLLGLGAYGAGYFGLIGEGVEPQGPVSLEALLFAMAAILPLALVWIGVMLLRRTAEVQRDARDLQTAIRKLQTDPVANRSARITPAGGGDTETRARLATMAEQMAQIERALGAMLQNQGTAIPEEPPVEAEPGLPLEPDEQNHAPPSWDELLRALNFPTDEKDQDGFRALRIAMRHHNTSLCIRAAEDIMNLLSQDGIYMDDFTPTVAPAEIWRKFSAGERGPSVAAIGGIDDEEVSEKIRERMRSDAIFRDAALHFQRQFDSVLKLFCEKGTDAYLERLGNTRTGRTFMLLGRVGGSFD